MKDYAESFKLLKDELNEIFKLRTLVANKGSYQHQHLKDFNPLEVNKGTLQDNGYYWDEYRSSRYDIDLGIRDKDVSLVLIVNYGDHLEGQFDSYSVLEGVWVGIGEHKDILDFNSGLLEIKIAEKLLISLIERQAEDLPYKLKALWENNSDKKESLEKLLELSKQEEPVDMLDTLENEICFMPPDFVK